MAYCEMCGESMPQRCDEYMIEKDGKTMVVCVHCFYKHYREQRLKQTPKP